MAKLHRRKPGQAYSGFFLTFEAGRKERIDAYLRFDKHRASEAFSAVDWTFERCEAVLLALDPEGRAVSGVALMRRSHGTGGTGNLLMSFEQPVMFEKPVKLPSRMLFESEVLISTSERPRRLDEHVWVELIDLLKQRRPDRAEDIDALLKRRESPLPFLGDGDRIALLAQQRDAVGMALDIGGVDRRNIFRSTDLERIEEADSVVSLLDHEKLHEQDAIRHDQKLFGSLLRSGSSGMVFRGTRNEVRVHVYDKKSIETALGIDLLIYQQAYRSFILLQYKMMKPNVDGVTGWSYAVRPGMKEQLVAMEMANRAIAAQSVTSTELCDWRLKEQPFFWKFCEAQRASAQEGSLLRGITLDLDHVNMFLDHPDARGRQGGLSVGYGNCPRYLSNTQFVELAAGGWIGTGFAGFKYIKNILEANREGGRQAVLAVVKSEEPLTANGRRRH